MSFPLVQNDEFDSSFILLEGLLPDGNLPPEGGSGERAEFDDERLLCHCLHEIERLVVQRHEDEIRRHLPGFGRSLGKLVEAG